jgi:hypothetical protein
MKPNPNRAWGERVARGKLTDQAVIEIRDLYRLNWKYPAIAARYRVCLNTIYDAIRGRTWSHVPNAVGPEERRRSGRRKGERCNITFGMRHGAAKLTDAKVREARRLARTGIRITEIARQFGVTRTAASNAIQGLTWRHIPMETDSPGPQSLPSVTQNVGD